MKKIKTITLLFMMFIIPISNIMATEIGWGLSPSKNGEKPFVGAKYLEVIEGHETYYMGNYDEKKLYLTFDLGYEAGYTAQTLDILKEKGVTACFFVTGYYVDKNPELIKRMVAEGHLVGNHTQNHHEISKLSLSELENELKMVSDSYAQITGNDMEKIMRPPKGVMDEESLTNLDKLGYKNYLWSLAYCDYGSKEKGKDFAYKQIMSRIHNGAIILLHLTSPDNTLALGTIIDELHADGYEFSCLSSITRT